jgi:phosphoribosylglycinamide formyltransferase-1
MLKLGVLVSGNGSNLQAILDAVHRGTIDAQVALVISNQPSAHALTRARQAGVPAQCISHRDFASREEFDRSVVSALKAAEVEWVVLAGFMRLLTPYFLEQFPNRILNIHPSLLPAFPGVNAIGQALRAGVPETGCTVHLVDQGLDSGPILARAAVPVLRGDTEESLAQRVHVAEHQLYVDTLRRLSTGELQLPPPHAALPQRSR